MQRLGEKMQQHTDAWMEQVLVMISTLRGQGGALLALPDYRPDLAKAIAHKVGVRFYDFRAEAMAQQGHRAGAMSLVELDAVLGELAAEGGAVVFNVEALLSTKSSEERGAWMEGFVGRNWQGLLLVPLTLYGHEAAAVTECVLRLEAEDLPAQGLLSRLVN